MSKIPAEPFVIIDGSSYLFRAYHALPPLTNDNNHPTGAMFGVISMLRNNIERYKPKYLAMVFDYKGPNFRHELFPEYKANRTETPEDLLKQFLPLNEIIQAMGIKIIMVPKVEADDVIATLATMAKQQNIPTIISTSDKDLAQLVDHNTILVNTMSDYIMDLPGVVAKFAVEAHQIVDYLTLIGDTVDNIPGVPKCGPKTAVKWLQEYGTLENIVANADKITGKVGEYLREAIEHLPLYKELIIVRRDLNLAVRPQDFTLGEPNNGVLAQLYKEYNFKMWLKELENKVANANNKLMNTPLITVLLDSIAELFKIVDNKQPIAIQLHNEQIECYVKDKCYQIPWEQSLLLFTASHQLIVYDAKPLIKKALDAKVKVGAKIFDIKVAAYVLNSTDDLSLAALTKKYLHIELDDAPGLPHILALYLEFNGLFKTYPALQKVFNEIETPMISVLAIMEHQGVFIDVPTLQAQSTHLAQALENLESEIFKIANQSFNLSSPKQLQEIMFDKLGLPIIKRTPKGQPSTDEAVLQELALEYELPKLLLNYRSLFKLKSTYTDRLPFDVNPATQRIHTTYQQTVTSTGRLSSTDPNLQNIPIKTAEGRKIRQAFVAPKGKIIIAADYSQIELRIMAHLSQDKTLLETFAKGLDVHSMTASEVFNVPLTEVTVEQRRLGKTINFGLIYGMGAVGLAKQLGVTRSEAQSYIDSYFHKFPMVKEFMQKTKEFAAKNGYVETLFGRRLYLPEINASNAMLKNAAERAAINAPMQGAQADIIKIAMIALNDWQQNFNDIKMIMQIHDELIFEANAENFTEKVNKIKEIMEGAAKLSVPLLVDIGTGTNWDNAKS